MAGYLSPGAYFYAEEQEYLQAYEDVLERYKGRAALPAPLRAVPCRAVPRRVWRLRGRERWWPGGEGWWPRVPAWVGLRGTDVGGLCDRYKYRVTSPVCVRRSRVFKSRFFQCSADTGISVSMCIRI